MADPVKQLYDYFSPGNEGLGSLEEFNANLQDSTQRRKFYDYFSPNNPTLGTFEDFNKRLLPYLEPPDTSLIDTSEIVPDKIIPDNKIKDRKDRKYKYDQYNPFPDVNMAIAKFEDGDRADFHNQYGAHTVPFDSTKKQYMIDNFGMEQGDPLPENPNIFTASYPTKALGKAASDYMIKSIWEENDGNVEDFVQQYTGITDRDSMTFKNYVNEIKYNMNSNEPSGHNTAIANSIYRKYPNLPRVEIRGSKGYVNPYGVGTPLEYIEDGYGKRVEFDTDLTTETDVMLDILHAIPTGKDTLLKGMYDKFAENIVNTRGEDIDYFYEQAREENPELPKEEFVQNYVDSQLRAVIAQDVGGASDPQYKLDYNDLKQLSPDAVKLGQDVLGYMTAYADSFPSLEETIQPEEALLDSYSNITSALDVKGIDLRNNKEAQRALRRNRIKTGESVTYDIKSSMPSLTSAYNDPDAKWDTVDFTKLLPGDIIKIGNVSHMVKDFDEIQDMAETVKFNKVLQELKDDPALVDIPFIGKTPLKAVVDKVAYQTADLFTVGLSKRWMDKPPLLEAMDISNSKIEWSDDNARMQTARVFEGIGETAGGLFQVIAALETAGMLGYGAAGTGAIGFAGLGGFRRLADPEVAMQMTPRKWVVGTGLDAILGASFPFLGRLGGEVIRTQGSNVKAFSKYLMQTGALGTAMTATQFGDQWNSWMVDNPGRTAMEGLLEVGEGVLQPANLIHTYGLMAALHATGTYTRFLPGKKAKTKNIIVYDPIFARSQKFDAKWYSSLSGKERADILARQFEIAGEIADGILKYDPITGEYKPLEKPATMAEAHELYRREVLWIKKFMNGEEVPFIKTEAEFATEEVKAEPKKPEVKVEKPKVEEVVVEGPAEPVTPEEYIKQAELELEKVPEVEEPKAIDEKLGDYLTNVPSEPKELKELVQDMSTEELNEIDNLYGAYTNVVQSDGSPNEGAINDLIDKPQFEGFVFADIFKAGELAKAVKKELLSKGRIRTKAKPPEVVPEAPAVTPAAVAPAVEEVLFKSNEEKNALRWWYSAGKPTGKDLTLALAKEKKANVESRTALSGAEGLINTYLTGQGGLGEDKDYIAYFKQEPPAVEEVPAEVKPMTRLDLLSYKLERDPKSNELYNKWLELKDAGKKEGLTAEEKLALKEEAWEVSDELHEYETGVLNTIPVLKKGSDYSDLIEEAPVEVPSRPHPAASWEDKVDFWTPKVKAFLDKQGILEKDHVKSATLVAKEFGIGHSLSGRILDKLAVAPEITEPSEIAEEPPAVRDYGEDLQPRQAFELPDQVKMKVADVNVDLDRFQPPERAQGEGFDEERVNLIVENFNPAKLEALWVWQDPASRKFFVLAGHHRIEAMKRLKYDDVPVKIFKGTEEDAIEFAATENEQRAELSIKDKIYAVGLLHGKGMTNKEILGKMPNLKNDAMVKKIVNLTYLDPNGSFMQHYNNNTMRFMKPMAETVGIYRKRHGEDFRDIHEQEIFDYMWMHGGSEVENHREVIDYAIERRLFMLKFDGKPLNITKPIVRPQAENEYSERIRDLEKELKDIEKRERDLIKRATAQKTPQKKIDAAVSLLTQEKIAVRAELDKLSINRPAAMDQIRRQTNMFASKKASTNAVQKGIHDIQRHKDQKRSKNFKLSDEVKKIYKEFNVPLRERGLSKRFGGIFNMISRRVRLHSSYDIIGAIHEITHAIDIDNGITSKLINKTKKDAPIRKLLTELYVDLYAGGKEKHRLDIRLKEGLSSLVENYFFDRDFMRGRYPDAVKELETEGGALYHPKLNKMIGMFDDIVDTYHSLTPPKKVYEVDGKKFVLEPPPLEQGAQLLHHETNNIRRKNPHGQSWYRYFEHNIGNEYEPAERWAKKLGLKGMDDPFAWSPMMQNKTMMIFNALKGSKVGTGLIIPKANGDIIIRDYSLADAIKGFSSDEIDQFDTYLTNKRYLGDVHHRSVAENAFKQADEELNELLEKYDAAELDEQVEMDAELKRSQLERDMLKRDYDHIKGKISRDHGGSEKNVMEGISIARRIVDQFDEQYEKNFVTFIKIANDVLEILYEGGVISGDTKETLQLSNNRGFYAPLLRLIYDSSKDNPHSFINQYINPTIGKGRQFMKAHGSTLEIMSPMQAMSTMLAVAYDNAILNIFWQKMGNMGKQNRYIAEGFELETNPPASTWVDLKEEDGVMTGGYSINNADKSLGKNKIKVYRDGTPEYITVYDEYVLMSETLNVKQLDEFGRILLSPTRWFTRATTGMFAPFMIKNFTRDQLEALQNSEVGYKPFFSPLSFGKSLILKKIANITNEDIKYYNEWVAQGGEKQLLLSFYDLSKDNAALKDWLQGKDRKITKIIDKGIDYASIPANFSEIISRVTEYKNARKKGMSQAESMHHSNQVTLPFPQMGAWWGSPLLRTLVKSVPYLNPSIISTWKLFERFRNNPKRTASIISAQATMNIFATISALMLLSDEDRRKALLKLAQTPLSILSRNWTMPGLGGDLIHFAIPDHMGAVNTLVMMFVMDLMGKWDKAEKDENRKIGVSEFYKYNWGEYLNVATGWLPEQAVPTDFEELEKGNYYVGTGKWLFSLHPHVSKVAIQLYANRKTFPSLGNIVPGYMSNWSKSQQYADYTSDQSKWMADYFKISPLEFDYFLRSGMGSFYGMFAGNFGSHPFYTGFEKYAMRGRLWNSVYEKNLTLANFKSEMDGGIGQPKRDVFDWYMRDKVYGKMIEAKGKLQKKYNSRYNQLTVTEKTLGTKSVFADSYLVEMYKIMEEMEKLDFAPINKNYTQSTKETYEILNRIKKFADKGGVDLPLDKEFMRQARAGRLTQEAKNKIMEYMDRSDFINEKMNEGHTRSEAKEMWKVHKKKNKRRR